MRQTIYTIPIDEVLSPKSGCPLCRMRDMLEERALEYTMGAAMMEPDVRIEMNRHGFCEAHFRQMLQRGNRLSLALILQSHLLELQNNILHAAPPLVGADKRVEQALAAVDGCYVCQRIEVSFSAMIDTIFSLWGREESFRTQLLEQELLCFPHFTRLLASAGKLPRKQQAAFKDALCKLACGGIDPAKADIDCFCDLFDYRSPKGAPVPEAVKNAPERAAGLLVSKNFIPSGDK